MASFTVRALTAEDLDRTSDIESRITGRPRRGFLEKRLLVATAAPKSFITSGALDGARLMGYGFARLQEGEFGIEGVAAVLDIIGVEPEAQGKGIGKALMAEIEGEMKRRHISMLKTQAVWTDHRIINFFSSAGFALAPSQILERDTSPLDEDVPAAAFGPQEMAWQERPLAGGRYFPRLARDRLLVRSLKAEDLPAVVRIDNKLTGLDRSAYYDAKVREMLVESGIRVSLVAEDEGIVSGFVMARVDFGEFGKVEKAAVVDTIGVHPAYRGAGFGRALLSQLLINLAGLKVETLRTQVSWKNFDLQRFLYACGFGPSQRLVLVKRVN